MPQSRTIVEAVVRRWKDGESRGDTNELIAALVSALEAQSPVRRIAGRLIKR